MTTTLSLAADRDPALVADRRRWSPSTASRRRRRSCSAGLPVDDRGVVVHRAGGAERRPGGVHRQAVVRGVEDVLLARHAVGPVGQGTTRRTAPTVGLAGVGLVGRRPAPACRTRRSRGRTRPGGRRTARRARSPSGAPPSSCPGSRPRRAPCPCPSACRIGMSLLPTIWKTRSPLLGVDDGASSVGRRRVDRADAGVEDPLSRRACSCSRAGCRPTGELAQLLRRCARSSSCTLLRRRVRDEQPRAVGGDAHVVGAVALHREAPDDRAGGEVDADHVGEARPARRRRAARRGCVNMSSTYWSWPSPTPCWIARKNASLSGS